MPYAVSKAEFARLVELALTELPPRFQEFLEEVPVQIEWAPSRRLLKQLDMQEDELLMGLYQGSSLLNRSETEGRGTPMPNHILIFQEDHQLLCDSEQGLIHEVRMTILHEI